IEDNYTGYIGRVVLCNEHIACLSRALFLHPSHVLIEEAADLVVAEHAGDHLLHELVPADLLAERLALARIFHRRVQTCSNRARGAGGDREAAVVEAAHRDLESVSLVADAV